MRDLLCRRTEEQPVDEAREDEVNTRHGDRPTLDLDHGESLRGQKVRLVLTMGRGEKGGEQGRTIIVVVMRRTPETAKPYAAVRPASVPKPTAEERESGQSTR